jgi:hypothetical protein
MSETKVVSYHRDFAATDEHFKFVCEKAGVLPTRRQASKFRRHFGRAWDAHLSLTVRKEREK